VVSPASRYGRRRPPAPSEETPRNSRIFRDSRNVLRAREEPQPGTAMSLHEDALVARVDRRFAFKLIAPVGNETVRAICA
jgi:hypothetical protein